MKLPQNETLRLGTVDIFNHISVCESEFILPAFSFAQKLGMKLDSNVLRNIVTSIGIHINDLGLLDLCQLHARLSDLGTKISLKKVSQILNFFNVLI